MKEDQKPFTAQEFAFLNILLLVIRNPLLHLPVLSLTMAIFALYVLLLVLSLSSMVQHALPKSITKSISCFPFMQFHLPSLSHKLQEPMAHFFLEGFLQVPSLVFFPLIVRSRQASLGSLFLTHLKEEEQRFYASLSFALIGMLWYMKMFPTLKDRQNL